MPGICRQQIDSAGGTLQQGSPSVFINGAPAVRVGDAVAGHGLSPHDSPVMQEGSQSVRVNGLAVCRAGDAASCGDTATGSTTVAAG